MGPHYRVEILYYYWAACLPGALGHSPKKGVYFQGLPLVAPRTNVPTDQIPVAQSTTPVRPQVGTEGPGGHTELLLILVFPGS